MLNYALLLGLIGAVLAYHAWRENIVENRRDSRLLAGLALATLTGTAAMVLA